MAREEKDEGLPNETFSLATPLDASLCRWQCCIYTVLYSTYLREVQVEELFMRQIQSR